MSLYKEFEPVNKDSYGSFVRYRTLVLWVYDAPDVLNSRLDRRVDLMVQVDAHIASLYVYTQHELKDITSHLCRKDWSKKLLACGIIPVASTELKTPRVWKKGSSNLSDTRNLGPYQPVT